VQNVRPDDPGAKGMDDRPCGTPALLVEASRRDATCDRGQVVIEEDRSPDLGDLIVVLLAGTLAGLRDRLYEDGLLDAGDLVAELVDSADAYLTSVSGTPRPC
jgi:hypothetical protein